MEASLRSAQDRPARDHCGGASTTWSSGRNALEVVRPPSGRAGSRGPPRGRRESGGREGRREGGVAVSLRPWSVCGREGRGPTFRQQ